MRLDLPLSSALSRTLATALLGSIPLFACGGDPLDPMTGEPDPGDSGLDPDGGATSAGDGAGGGGGGGGGDAAPAKVPCAAGMSARWACDATNANRVRCVDGYVEEVACANGCTAPVAAGDEAVCSCGADTAFSRWNCSASDGNLYACPGGAFLEQSCGGRGCDVGPNGVSDSCKRAAGGALQTAIDALGPQCGLYSPGSDCGIAVKDLVTGESAAWRSNAFYVSASSAKALWVAAALYDTSIDAVSPYATPIFANSDNYASGSVIDLLSSPARVNTFMWRDIGVPDSGFCHWNYGKTRDAANCPATMAGDNFFTAGDMVQFLVELWDRSLLGDAKASAELGWMKLSPRSGYGGWIGTQLPEAARPNVHHKAGWLPPSAVPGYSNSNEIGIVEVPGGHAYAVALLMNGAASQTAYDAAQLPTLEYASCVVYHAVANDGGGGGCAHP